MAALLLKVRDRVGKAIYDYVCANRADNKSKNPREISCEYENLTDNAKEHYRCIGDWHTMEMNKRTIL